MAHYAATPDTHVTLVTCTLGEEGEIYVPELSQLAAAESDQLGGYRLVELERACAALGVTDHRFLGGAGRYRDSGMMGLPTNGHKRAFWQANLEEAAGHLVTVLAEVRPQVLVTYDTNGSYGHPDHIQSHRVAMRAAELATAEGFGPDKIYWTALPRSVMAAGLEMFAQTANNPFEGVTSVDDLPMAIPDERIAARIDARDFADAKMAAVRAHATQIAADNWLYSLAANLGADYLGVEYFELVAGERGPAGPDGLETDLFAGLPTS